MEKTVERRISIKDKQEIFTTKTLSHSLKNQSYADISKLKEKWTDDLFPPCEESMYSGKTEFSQYIQPQIPKFLSQTAKAKFNSQYTLNERNKKYVWKRLSDVFKAGEEMNILKIPSNYKDDPDVLCEDVVQGELGDCYFLSAISALAEFPDRIKHVVPSTNFTKSGAFEAMIYLHGEPTRVVVDDYFPFTEEGNVAFAGMNNTTKNIWPLILEKVWAKVNLSYEDIIAGNSSEAFEFLTPAPIDTFYHDVHGDKIFEEIEKADKKNYIICTDVTVTENTNIDHLTKMGLITNHAYTIIDVARVQYFGKEVKLLKIRNPWGTNEWLGDWSDNSSKWTPELKAQLNMVAEDDGTYWISYDDFLQYYTSTHICKVKDNYNFSSNKYKINKEHSFNMVSIKIPTNSSGFFEVNLKNRRVYKNSKGLEDFDNQYCSLIVFRQDGEKFTYIGATCGRNNRLYVECENMVKGTYYVAVSFPVKSHSKIDTETTEEIRRKQNESLRDGLTYRVGVYSPFEKVDINSVQPKDYEILSQFIHDIIQHRADENTDKHSFDEEGEKSSWRSISFEKDAGSLGYIFYQNNSDGFIHEHLTFTQFQNLNLIPMLKPGALEELDVDHETSVEDATTRDAITALRKKAALDSKLRVINAVDAGKEVSVKNPLEIVISIAPNSNCMVLLEKIDEDSAIELSSRIAITYPTYAILPETKFISKKNRLKYNNKLVEIYECVIEHTAGVIFKYKNKTKDLKVSAHVIFPDLENLKISLKGDDLFEVEGGQEKVQGVGKQIESGDYEIRRPDKEMVLTLAPGEIKFFELSAVDIFEPFAYSCEMEYNISLSRGQK